MFASRFRSMSQRELRCHSELYEARDDRYRLYSALTFLFRPYFRKLVRSINYLRLSPTPLMLHTKAASGRRPLKASTSSSQGKIPASVRSPELPHQLVAQADETRGLQEYKCKLPPPALP